MKTAELRDKTIPELQAALTATRREQFKLRLQKAGGETTSSHPIRGMRRDIARIMTVIREKERFAKQEGK